MPATPSLFVQIRPFSGRKGGGATPSKQICLEVRSRRVARHLPPPVHVIEAVSPKKRVPKRSMAVPPASSPGPFGQVSPLSATTPVTSPRKSSLPHTKAATTPRASKDDPEGQPIPSPSTEGHAQKAPPSGAPLPSPCAHRVRARSPRTETNTRHPTRAPRDASPQKTPPSDKRVATRKAAAPTTPFIVPSSAPV